MADAMVTVRARGREREWGALTALLIAGATLVRLLFVGSTDIANGEAYYYVWSRFPSLSYYDHPPLVAWMAWLTTRASHGSLAIRSGPLLCAALSGALLYLLGRRLFSPRAGFLAVATVTVMPGLLRLELRAEPRGAARAAVGARAPALERMRDPRRGLAAARRGRGGRAGLPRQVLGRAPARGGPALRAGLPPADGAGSAAPRCTSGSLVALAVATPVLVWNHQRGWPSLVAALRRAPRVRPIRRRWRSTPGTRWWGSSARSIRSSFPR